LSPKAKTGAIPSRLAILGNVTPSRRNFQAVITHLHAAIKGESISIYPNEALADD
jgi:hypothetical protein